MALYMDLRFDVTVKWCSRPPVRTIAVAPTSSARLRYARCAPNCTAAWPIPAIRSPALHASGAASTAGSALQARTTLHELTVDQTLRALSRRRTGRRQSGSASVGQTHRASRRVWAIYERWRQRRAGCYARRCSRAAGGNASPVETVVVRVTASRRVRAPGGSHRSQASARPAGFPGRGRRCALCVVAGLIGLDLRKTNPASSPSTGPVTPPAHRYPTGPHYLAPGRPIVAS